VTPFCWSDGGRTGERHGKQLATLERQYAVLARGPDRDLDAIEPNLYRIVQLLAGPAGVADRSKANAVVEQAKKDLAGHADTERTKRLFSMLAGVLNHPVPGGTLELAFTALDGTKVDLASMKGKVVLVIYVEPSPDEDDARMLKQAMAARDKLHGRGFEVIGLSLEKDKSVLADFVRKEGFRWPQAHDSQGWDYSLAVKFSVNSLPFNFLVGKDGKMAVRPVQAGELEAKVTGLLERP
jgi:peroxiredoxin